MLPLETKHYSPIRISGGGGVFVEEVSRSRKQVAGSCGYGEELSSFMNAGLLLAFQEGLWSMEKVSK
jgi:hypothetical protein